MFHGSIVALVTPFRNGSIDEEALARLVHFHLENGTNGIVPVGTTGEAPTLSKDEHRRVIEIVAHESGGQLPVIAGCGSYDPVDAIKQTKSAEAAGADATLHVMGYYNRPNQQGMYQHFEMLNDATDLPILVYNIPPRAIIDIEPETMARIAELKNVVGVKDSTGDLSRPLAERQLIGDGFCLLTGEDLTTIAHRASGGNGCISVTANVAPKLCSTMQEACSNGDFQTALQIQMRLLPLHQALFLEPSPAGVKYACSLLGFCEPKCRLPIVELSITTKTAIDKAMHGLDLV